jgi:hypothetical protein
VADPGNPGAIRRQHRVAGADEPEQTVLEVERDIGAPMVSSEGVLERASGES